MSNKNVHTIVDHLFRKEYGKLVSYLTVKMGYSYFSTAEDIAQETLEQACKSWRDNQIPDNPSAWLFTVARNKAYHVLEKENNRQKIRSNHLQDSFAERSNNIPFLAHEIEDSMLRMFFLCCSIANSRQNKLLLILNILCGFSRNELSHTFLIPEETVKKRLYRLKKGIRSEKLAKSFVDAPIQITELNAVRHAIYLLFNKGYQSYDGEAYIQKEVCLEAMRLSKILLNRYPADFENQALYALFCFHAARFGSRIDLEGDLVLLQDQDRSKWNKQLIETGIFYLSEASSKKAALSTYHIEANIAALHCSAKSIDDTNWDRILVLYTWLNLLRPSSAIDLNIAIITGVVYGAEKGLEQLVFIRKNHPELEKNYVFHASRAFFLEKISAYCASAMSYQRAYEKTKSEKERRYLKQKIKAQLRFKN